MTDEEILAAMERARGLASGQPEPYRTVAYRVLLERFLGFDLARNGRNGRPADLSAGLAEFLAARGPDSHPARVTAIAYYYFHHADGAAITARDIIDAYTRARVRKPQNIPDVIATCVRRGYLVDRGRKDGLKAWVITGAGDQFIEGELSS
jgi:hypothetical protein